MEDQRDLISNHEQLPMLGQRPGAPESKCSRGALYTGFSVLVALLLAGQATTAYFLYQQQGRLDKLTVTSQNLQLESLRMKLPKPSKPLSKMRVSAPMLMQALPMEGPEPMRNATKYGNMTQDHVMHLLLKSDPLGVYPKLKGSLPENLKHLKNTMDGVNWKLFENWLRQWLLFEMSKNSLEETPFEVPPKDPLETEDLSSGLGVTKQDLGQATAPLSSHPVRPADASPQPCVATACLPPTLPAAPTCTSSHGPLAPGSPSSLDTSRLFRRPRMNDTGRPCCPQLHPLAGTQGPGDSP
uniref:CD74 molecule n=1 Tax=Sus scrofa TaxID=9823 RepID=A0A8D2BH31_PIG